MNKNRRWLFLLLAAGLIALGAGGGTFATFNAQTTNPGNSFATGSLYLSDQANSGTACFSFTGSNNQNTGSNSGCGTVIDVTGEQPGSTPDTTDATGTVTLSNVGTLAGTLTTDVSSCVDHVPTETTTGNVTATSNTISGIASMTGITVGMTVTDGTHPSYLTNAYVTSVGSSSVTISSAASGTATGDSLTFQSSSTGSLCSALDAFVAVGTVCYYGNCPTGDTGSSSDASLSGLTGNIFSTPLALSAGASKTVTIGLYLVSNGSGTENNLMDLSSTFDMTFTLTQS